MLHTTPRLSSALVDLATSIVPYLALMLGAFVAVRSSYLLAFVLSLLAGAFLIRTFIVFHDCAHGSFVRSRRANAVLGSLLGVPLYMPFQWWRHKHAVHHATAGDLDRRGTGDIQTLTVSEYGARPWWGRLAYRLFRNPLVMFVIGPLWVVVVGPRLVTRTMHPRLRSSVLGADLALGVTIGALCWLVGWENFLLVQAPALMVSGVVGIWLFYVQHQFEGTYWQTHENWSYDQAALEGSSYLKLPRILRFFTGNIGLHHVHHLSARIPNYKLHAAHEAAALDGAVRTISLWDGIRAVQLKLWDENQGRLVTFRQASARLVPGPSR